MNNLHFNQTGGFPLSTNILDAMQTAYSVFNHLGNLAGNLAIISGCEVVGNSVSNGAVFINGEILDFKGGAIGTSVIIKEEIENRVFEDGSTKQAIFKRYASFGSSTPEKTFVWADFKRFENLVENAKTHADFETRLTALENKKSPIPIGLIAIWGKPSTEPIPDGWQECTDLRGKFPLGWNPDDTDFANLGATGGEKTHILKKEEMPIHYHNTFRIGWGSGWGAGMGQYAVSGINHGGKDNYNITGTNNPPNGYKTGDEGGNQAHNNMPPYRIIKYIEFIGF
ncbi:MAG: hypothetical protein Q4C75_02775 [Bergeyella zoohelcum]|nr:hypothetical protein [Bergeyella zoohelcum]